VLEPFTDLGCSGLRQVGEVDGDEAGSLHLGGKAVGVVDGWTLIWDPMMFLGEGPEVAVPPGLWPRQVEEALVHWSQRTRIYSFLTEGSSGTYGFAWYANGTRRRLCLRRQGTLVLEDGSVLPEERDAEAREPNEEPDENPDDEQVLFALMEGLTGVSMDAVLSD
jgi:hypothetical protein